MDVKLSSVRMMSDASLATSVPAIPWKRTTFLCSYCWSGYFYTPRPADVFVLSETSSGTIKQVIKWETRWASQTTSFHCFQLQGGDSRGEDFFNAAQQLRWIFMKTEQGRRKLETIPDNGDSQQKPRIDRFRCHNEYESAFYQSPGPLRRGHFY